MREWKQYQDSSQSNSPVSLTGPSPIEINPMSITNLGHSSDLGSPDPSEHSHSTMLITSLASQDQGMQIRQDLGSVSGQSHGYTPIAHLHGIPISSSMQIRHDANHDINSQFHTVQLHTLHPHGLSGLHTHHSHNMHSATSRE